VECEDGEVRFRAGVDGEEIGDIHRFGKKGTFTISGQA